MLDRPRNIGAGEDYREAIIRGVRECRALVVVCTRQAGSSENVIREVSLADGEKKPIFPVRIDDYEPEGRLQFLLVGKHWVDFHKNPAAAIGLIAEQVQGTPLTKAPALKLRSKRRMVFAYVAIAAAVLVAGGYFGERLWAASRAIADCDAAAGSPLAFDPEAGPGVPFGMIKPGRALRVCRRAVEKHPNSARMRFNLFRAQAATRPLQLEGFSAALIDSVRAAAELGHPEAVITFQRIASDADDGEITPLPVETVSRAFTQLVNRALQGDPRAQYLAAQSTYLICNWPATQDQQHLFDWMKQRYAAQHPEAAAAIQTASTASEFTAAVGRDACEFAKYYLLASASAANIPAAQLDLAAEGLSSTPQSVPYDSVESRTPAQLLTAAVNQNYGPAIYYGATREIDCPARQDDAQVRMPTRAQWRTLTTLSNNGYRPAMIAMASLIVGGCSPENLDYTQARALLDRAAEGMEREP